MKKCKKYDSETVVYSERSKILRWQWMQETQKR